MEEFLLRLQESDFGVWVSSAPTLLAYPTILMLHTVGLAMIVGPAVGPRRAAARLRRAPAGGGAARRVSHHVDRLLHQCIDRHRAVHFRGGRQGNEVDLLGEAGGDRVGARSSRAVSGAPCSGGGVAPDVAPPKARTASPKASLALWFVAITAGRLMAYIK